MLGVYKEFLETELAVPVLDGRKTESEKFAGAAHTYSVEALMGDGRALQAGTSLTISARTSRRSSTLRSRRGTSPSSTSGRPRGA